LVHIQARALSRLLRSWGGQMQGAAPQAMCCIVEERQRRRCPPAAAPRRAAGLSISDFLMAIARFEDQAILHQQDRHPDVQVGYQRMRPSSSPGK
jgi:hypothetical protein